MTKFLTSESFYKSELDELYKFLNEINRIIASSNSDHSFNEIKDTCLFRIKLMEGLLSELAALKIN